MKKHLLFLLFLSFSIFYNTQAQENQWEVLPVRSQQEFELGKFGGAGEQHPHSISRCFQHPEYIYLSQDVGGSWRSTDNGETWEKGLDKGLFLPFGQSIAVDPVDPNIVFIIVDESHNYLGGSYQGVYRSEDGGENWTHVLAAETKVERIYRHNLEFARSGMNGEKPVKTWYAAMPDNGLYRSDDGGKNWTTNPVSSLEGHDIVYQVRTHPTDSQKVYVASSLGLFVSLNKGDSLTRVEVLPENVTSLNINYNNPDSIYATVQNDGLYLSTDGGEIFNKIKTHSALRLHMNPGFPEQIYLVGSNRNSQISNNGGKDWRALPEATTFPGLGRENGWRRWIDGKLSGIVPNPNNKNEAVFYSRSTLFKTTDGAKTIEESATGWTGNAWSWTDNSAAFHPFNPDTFAFFCNDIGTRITTTGGDWFHESTNSEAGSWYPEKIGWYGTYAGDFQPKKGSATMVAAIGAYFKTQLMRSEDLGQTWNLITQGSEQEEMHLFVKFHTEDPDFVYAGNKYSTDAGKTFQFFNFPEGYADSYVIGMCNAYPDVVYALNKSCTTLLRSCDRGTNWEVYSKPGWRFRYYDSLPTFIADPINPFKVYTLDKNHDLAVFDGTKWSGFHVKNNISGAASYDYVRNVAIDPNNPDIIYAGMFASGGPMVLRTLDGGDSWEDISHNLPRIGGALKVNPHTGELYRGSLFGTWIFPAPYDEVPAPEIPDFKTEIEITNDTLLLVEEATKALEINTTWLCTYQPQIEWISSDTTVAKVDQAGTVTAVSPGNCIISAQVGSAGEFSDSCFVVVDAKTSAIYKTEEPNFSACIKENSLIINLENASPVIEISIYSLSGSKVMNKSFGEHFFTGQNIFDVSHLKKGIYILAVNTGKRILTQKIAKNYF